MLCNFFLSLSDKFIFFSGSKRSIISIKSSLNPCSDRICSKLLFPDFKFASHYLVILFKSGNISLGVIAFSAMFGCLACGLLWFPSYLWNIINLLGSNNKVDKWQLFFHFFHSLFFGISNFNFFLFVYKIYK